MRFCCARQNSRSAGTDAPSQHLNNQYTAILTKIGLVGQDDTCQRKQTPCAPSLRVHLCAIPPRASDRLTRRRRGAEMGSAAEGTLPCRGRFLGKPLCAIFRFRHQDDQTPPSLLVGEGCRGMRGKRLGNAANCASLPRTLPLREGCFLSSVLIRHIRANPCSIHTGESG